MYRRISIGSFSFALALVCAGCVSTPVVDPAPGVTAAPNGASPEVPPAKPGRRLGAKRVAQPKTEIAYGQMKETEAESDAAKSNPEAQARMRDDARRAYQAALKQDPNNIDAYRHLARLYAKMGDFDRAFKTYQEAMTKHPKDAPLWHDLTVWFSSDHGVSRCKNAALWYDLGLCHQRHKDLPESIKCFTKALEIEPENREYMKKLGFTLAYMGQTERGLELLTRAQGAALAHYGIARVMIQKDQLSKAQHHLQLALRENSQLEEARELLAGLANPTPNATPDQSVIAGGARGARIEPRAPSALWLNEAI